MNPETMEEALRQFIAGKTQLLSASEITKDTKLFSSGLLNSIVFVDLLIFIERQFKVNIRSKIDSDMRSLDSIDQIMQLINSCDTKA